METPAVATTEASARAVLAGDREAELVIAIGRAYHQAGVPSDQLEELMHEVARRVGLTLQVTALPTSITAAIGPGYAQRIVLLRLEPAAIDLRRLALLNVVFERVLGGRMSPSEALPEVERIERAPRPLRPFATIVAYMLLSLGVSILIGGANAEATAAALIGVAIGALSLVGSRIPAIARLFEVFAAFIATMIVGAYASFVPSLDVYVPIVAGVVTLLPGLQLTTALHELAYRNLVAGTARLGSVLMALLSLGCGFALAVALIGPGPMHVASMRYAPAPWYLLALAVLAVATGIAIVQDARAVDVPWVLGSCGVAELAFHLLDALPGYEVATFGAAVVVGLLTSLGARYARVPQAVLLVPGLLVLVPGALSYQSILLLLQSNAADAGQLAANTVIASVEIVAGVLLAQLFVAPPHGFRGTRV